MNILHRLVLPFVIGIVFLQGCGSAPKREGNQSHYATQVFVGRCVVLEERPESAALDSLVVSAIGQTLSGIGETLEASAAEQTWTSSGSTNFEWKLNQFPTCLQVIHGHFLPNKKDLTTDWAEGTAYAKHTVRLATRGIYLAAKPDFFFEGVFRASTEGSAIAIVPTAVGFHKPIGTRPLRFDDGRRTKLAIVIHPSGKAASDSSNTKTELDFGMLWPSDLLDFEQECYKKETKAASSDGGQRVNSPPASQPGVGAPDARPGERAPEANPGERAPEANPGAQAETKERATPGKPFEACPRESLWMVLSAGASYAPVSLTATISQTQDRSDVLGFISDLFKSSKTEIEAWAKEKLVKSEREKAELEALKSKTALVTTYTEDASNALQQLEACKSPGGATIANRSAARLAQMKANMSAAVAGLPQPFSAKDMPELASSDSDAQTACEKAIKNFR